jgi:hypothetical protein
MVGSSLRRSMLAVGGSTLADHSPRHPKMMGFSPAAVDGNWTFCTKLECLLDKAGKARQGQTL